MQLISDVRHVHTSFQENHHVEAVADGTEDLCEPLARQAWVPLEHREATLVAHEIANRIGERDVEVGLGDVEP